MKSPPTTTLFRRALLAWYDANHRELPWRQTSDPYCIWLSEIMLQQTRVVAVMDYYRRFLQRFPSVASLAAASEAEVLAQWSGLGYYRRARMLHAAARVLIAEYGGHLPPTSAELRRLPGIGRYTAAAIASIAFGEPSAVVDGNVERVISRLEGRANTAPAKGTEYFWRRAQNWLSPQRPGDFNQAMMELGATVCLPGKPSCGECPLRKWCATRGQLPVGVKQPKRVQKEVHLLVAQRTIVQRMIAQRGVAKLEVAKREVAPGAARIGNTIFLVQRPPDAAIMASMWELPELSAEGAPGNASPVLCVKHSITVNDYRVIIHFGPKPKGRFKTKTKARWVAMSELDTLPVTGLTRKILRRIGVLA